METSSNRNAYLLQRFAPTDTRLLRCITRRVLKNYIRSRENSTTAVVPCVVSIVATQAAGNLHSVPLTGVGGIGGGVGVGGTGPTGLVLMIPFGPSIEMSWYSTSPSCTFRERERERKVWQTVFKWCIATVEQA